MSTKRALTRREQAAEMRRVGHLGPRFWPKEARSQWITTAERGGSWSARHGFPSRINPYFDRTLARAWNRAYQMERKRLREARLSGADEQAGDEVG